MSGQSLPALQPFVMDVERNEIGVGVQLASDIYQYGFMEESPADVGYKNFQNDILSFRCLLDKLQEALQVAQQRYLDRARALGPREYEPLSNDFESERKTFLGDFLATLRSCSNLLQDNKKIRVRYSDTPENLSWRLVQQEHRVADLRGRLNLHSEKIRFVVDRLSMNFLTALDNNAHNPVGVDERSLDDASIDLSNIVSGHSNLTGSSSEDVHSIGGPVAARFREYLVVDAPVNVATELPLHQIFDALLVASDKSQQGSDQTPEKYLNFLKTRWILSRLKTSRQYRAACQGFYYKHAVHQLEQALVARMRQPGSIIWYPESVLMSLADSTFRIWPHSTPPLPMPIGNSHPLVARANEQQVVSIKLASDDRVNSDTVTVFRSSDERFRIVVASSVDSGKSFIPQTVYTSQDKLIPRYALPTIVNPVPEMAIFSRNEETLYKFDSFQDLYTFQSAVTGHEVAHDQRNIRCQFSDDAFFLDCIGRLQIWQQPIELPRAGEDDIQQQFSVRTQNSYVGVSPSRRDSLIPSVAPTNTVSWTTGGWEADNIKLPAITIFTQLIDQKKRTRFAIIYIPLEPGIYIDPAECACCRDYVKCSKLVLTKRKKSSFAVRVLYSDMDPTGLPNPNTFDIFPFRLPRHPKFHSITVQQTQYLVLKFPSLPEKQQFHRELDLRFRVRDRQITDQRLVECDPSQKNNVTKQANRDFTKSIVNRQDQPLARRQTISQSPSYPPSPSLCSLETSLPPTVEVDTGPAFGADVPHQSNDPTLSPIRTTRSMASTRTAESLCTSLNSMIFTPTDCEKIDVYLGKEINSPLIEPASVTSPLRRHPEFHGFPEYRPMSELARSPSSLAPERHDVQERNTYGSPVHQVMHPATRLNNPVAPQMYMPSVTKIHEAPDYNEISPIARSQSAIAPEYYSPESFVQGVHTEIKSQTRVEVLPVKHDRGYSGTEASLSRSKIGTRKGNFLRKLLAK